ncbi:putative membrane protein YfcA [Clostridium algifaecis]|uniref:Probable membrane transporter protein n=1 Tax=Clostridium algifaecis TaxID=1472040 RepID=A0ABS4KTP0_9CLOT|nr:TSUP family transporter [Clostridium algifaecis]MBP2033423.1 putative membrane protein YfcA [Clostridium algifaecis]
MTIITTKLIFLCIAGFFAAFVDSIAGGGGIISLPAFLISGVPPHLALGTNKFSSSCASLASSLKFAKSGKVDTKILKFLVPFTFIGAIIGTNVVLIVNTKYLNSIVLTLLILVSIYSLFSKSVGMEDNFKCLTKKSLFLGMLFAACLGFYDGFFGPGTGSFLIFGLIYIYNFDFVRSAGNGKVLNFVSNITSLIVFIINGQINYSLGIPVAICMILGARIGTRLALSRGANLIKPIFITISLCLAVKMIYGIVH